ncbi:MAG: hypothetical protein ACLFVU_08870 [Phycisphaerae bacterium]
MHCCFRSIGGFIKDVRRLQQLDRQLPAAKPDEKPALLLRKLRLLSDQLRLHEDALNVCLDIAEQYPRSATAQAAIEHGVTIMVQHQVNFFPAAANRFAGNVVENYTWLQNRPEHLLQTAIECTSHKWDYLAVSAMRECLKTGDGKSRVQTKLLEKEGYIPYVAPVVKAASPKDWADIRKELLFDEKARPVLMKYQKQIDERCREIIEAAATAPVATSRPARD